ncbi:retrovirus-related pol polyprotein from transposon TNT 1-94, partial [Tanacetum coccineum]
MLIASHTVFKVHLRVPLPHHPILLLQNPTDYDKAAKNQVWQDAMLKEIEAIEKNSTWELVDAPAHKNIVGLKWLFRTKYNADESIQKHKARLVAKGYSQKQGIDYEETFS